MKKYKAYKSIVSTMIFLSIVSVNYSATANPTLKKKVNQLPLEQIQLFADVFDKIKQEYIEDISDEELLNHAIKGMVSGLDPHSVFLDSSRYENFQVDTDGQFGGLGIEIIMEKGLLKIITPIDDTPASRAGLQAGDLILQIDDTKTIGLTQDECVDLLRGRPGSRVELTIARENEKKKLSISLKRAIINIKSIKHDLLENKYGYIRITQFQRETGLNLRKAIAKLKSDSENKLQGIVLDLRNNPGGILGAAIDVSNSFLSDGIIVTTKGRESDVQSSYSATAPDLLKDIPVVVIVNGGTASAAEIVAGALQDHNRAVLLGTRTFGKGSVQSIIPLTDSSALKFTTARYYTPLDRSIQATGIIPDILIEQSSLVASNEPPMQSLREEDLPGHLKNEVELDLSEEPELADADYQLSEALRILKGISIANKVSKLDSADK